VRIVFCDDNLDDLQTLRDYVIAYFKNIRGDTPDYAAYTNGDELLKNESSVDIAFLDVEMTGTSGIHVGDKLKKRNPYAKIIIITAYPDYLDEAMRFQVYRYISKPIDKNRLYRNIKDAVHQHLTESKRYSINTDTGLVVCRAEEIVSVEASNRKVWVHTVKQSYQSTNTIDYWKSTLDLPCFYITHRSHIVNMRYVSKITNDTVFLKYHGQERIAFLTYRNYRTFKKVFLSYQEGMR